MTNQELLEQALYSGAIIHQPHALKAYLSASYLIDYLGNDSELRSHTAELIANDSIHVLPAYNEAVQAPPLQEFRIHQMLRRGVYPASYQATSQWHQNKGFQDIFVHFANEASLNNEYLSHNVTILLALNLVYQQLSTKQVPAFLNRFTEFVTSTFSDVNKANGNKEKVAVTDVLASCLTQFGFFGHNLITLAWLLRCKEQLSAPQYEAMLSNLYSQANSPLTDPEDNIDLSIWDRCETEANKEIFVKRINNLIYEHTLNLHQITLADALCLLQTKYPNKTAELAKVAQYQSLVLENL
ncbi:hypothetical protein [Thaumasiovibrio sp. DFM-14]|uniref:hypothetical protein n=1 Tax=Thaumasiovibrio sp. DFM-14 TaxID=3384792 RepID=UPI00399FAC5A